MSVLSFTRLLTVSSCLLLCACSETIVKGVPDETNEQIDDAIEPSSSDTTGNQPTEELPANPVVTSPSTPSTEMSANQPDTMTDIEALISTEPDTNTVTSTEASPTTSPTTVVTPEVIDPPTTSTEPEQTSVTDTSTDLLADPILTDPDINSGSSPVVMPVTETPITDTPVPDTEEPPAIQPQHPIRELVVGAPGEVVDCQQQLPCRWISGDSQFSVTVTNSDNIASRGRLGIEFSISANHDTQVSIARSEAAFDAMGNQFEPADQILGNGNGGTPQGIVAGTTVQGVLNFDKSSTSDLLTQWAIKLIDGGMIRDAGFKNLYVGSATTLIVDCKNTLPCIWDSPDSTATVTLLSVGGLITANRLSASISVNTTTAQPVALDSGASGVGVDGTPFIARTHVLGDKDGYEKIVVNTVAGVPLLGIINFFRTAVMPDSLQDLSLNLYQDQPLPRWNPRFTAVPIQ